MTSENKNNASQELQTVRGMHDILPERSGSYQIVEAKAREIFALFGYKEIRTPVLESIQLFKRAIGEATDIVEKEMFVLKDRGEREMVLRPEGTAGVVRSYIEHHMNQENNIQKLFYMGPMFRAERPQKGRYREFEQIGSEYFGNEAPSADAETILLLKELLAGFGIASPQIQLNSIGCPNCRPVYQEALLKFLKAESTNLCANCKSRIEKNPLRVLDCKIDRDKIKGAPKTLDFLCADCSSHHKGVLELLDASETPHQIVPDLVRGLDYYTRTVFEIYPSGQEGSQDALAAGGRYDNLVENLGGPQTPAVGFALGVERILNQLELLKAQAGTEKKRNSVYVCTLGAESFAKAFQIMKELRAAGIPAEGVVNKQSLKSQMRQADKLKMRFCIIIGENELKENAAMLKDLEKQSQTKVPFGEIIDTLKRAEL